MLDLPLEQIHKQAFKAAEASHCAGDQGKFWEMHDRLFQNPRAIEPVTPHAEATGLDVDKFIECLNSKKHANGIRKEMGLAQSLGARSTPSFILGLTDEKDPSRVKGIAFIKGAQAYPTFKAAIDAALADLDK
jgi:protein-disulfide isomerase